MRKLILPVGLAALLGACGYVDKYERWVFDWEPTYCYQSIGGVECFRTPYHRDERRLVNYFGPHPSRYDKPEPPEPAALTAPAMINYWVKDPEPIPRPAPQGNVASLPWLDPMVAKADSDRFELAVASQSRVGTEALLKRMGIGPDGALLARAGKDAKNSSQLNNGITARPAAVDGDGAEAGAAEVRALPSEAPPPLAAPVPPVVMVPVN